MEQTFRQVLANLAICIEMATGVDKDGKPTKRNPLGRGHFLGFVLGGETRVKIGSAVDKIRNGRPEAEAIEILREARESFIGQETWFLRNKVLSNLDKLLASIAGKVGKDLIEPIRARALELNDYSICENVDLDKASKLHWEIVDEVNKACAQQKTRDVEQRQKDQVLAEERRRKFARARQEEREREASALEAEYAFLIA